MSVRVNTLSEAEIRSIGDAFADFEYADSEMGMSYLGKNRQAISDYICAYVRMAIRERVLYSTSENHEAYIAFKRSGHNMSISSAAGLIGTVLECVDYRNIGNAAKGFACSDKGYGDILVKFKIPHIYVGMVAVTKPYQGQGYMRKLLEIAFEEGRRASIPVVLDTDAELKKAKYEHLGMKCVTTKAIADGVKLYGMVYEPDDIPKEWRSDVVMSDYRIMKGKNESIWDKFASVYTSFVTGTPGNKRAYEAIFKRIRKVVRDKEVLEIATGPGVIAKQVADESKSMIATDFSEKMLAVALSENSHPDITYLHMPMEDLGQLKDTLSEDDLMFDVVISSLAFHYIEDFSGVLRNINSLMNKGGLFIFSQEHPLNTCFTGKNRWTVDENGNKLHVNLMNYCVEKETECEWFVDNVKRYHRMFSTIINTLIEEGFSIEKLIEPYPDEEILAKYPDYRDNLHKPDFLIVRSRKNE